MEPTPDTGPVIAVRRFAVLPADSVLTVTQRCHAEIIVLFYDLISGLAAGKPLPISEETWKRKPHTRRELDELCRVTPEMPRDEVLRRIRATTYPNMPGAYLEVDGRKLDLDPASEQPKLDNYP